MAKTEKSLTQYRKKRNFTKTSEPSGAKKKQAKKAQDKIFVIHKHNASHLHYDVRLEVGGVLKSWAVPKGVPKKISEKHLAIQTEDHPYDYAKFHGTIPEGNYGAGTVDIWDSGTYRNIKTHDGKLVPMKECLTRGTVEVFFSGKKLHGPYALIRTNFRGKPSWLMIKMKHREVASKKTSKKTKSADDEPDPEPSFIAPMLPKTAQAISGTGDWVIERKFDGQRCIAVKNGKIVTLYSRNKKIINDYYPELVRALQAQTLDNFVIDGEIVAGDSFADLQERMFVKHPSEIVQKTSSITYYPFDMMYCSHEDLRQKTFIDRKKLLQEKIEYKSPLRYVAYSACDDTSIEQACEKKWEGVIAKRKDSLYHSMRSGDWLKIKCENSQEFVVGGYTEPYGTRQHIGALLVGYYEKSGKHNVLRYAGKVGTGFTHQTLEILYNQLNQRVRKTCPFDSKSRKIPEKKVYWVEPDLVIQVRFAEWTNDGKLRHSRFIGVRNDKIATEIEREGAAVNKKKSNKKDTLTFGRIKVELTNQDKILYPDAKITKGDVIDYYHKIAPHMLPYVKNRAVTMLRFPEGIKHEGFYQKDISDYFPSWIKYKKIPKGEPGKKEAHEYTHYVVCNDTATLVYLANQACLTPHLWLSKIDKLDYPDRMIFDLDPGSKTDFQVVRTTAYKIKKVLEEIGLVPFIMTTGSRGVHVTVPLTRSENFDFVRALARDIADFIAEKDSKNLTTEMRLNKRKGRLFIDSGRNAFAQTAVAPYALRAHPGAPVATPLQWSELKNIKTSQAFTIKNIFKRVTRVSDPWKGFQGSARSISAARKKFDRLFQ